MSPRVVAGMAIGLFAAVLLPCFVFAQELPMPVSPGAVDRFVTSDLRCPTFSWGADSRSQSYELAVFSADLDAPDEQVVFDPASAVRRTLVPSGATSWTPSGRDCLPARGNFYWAIRAQGAQEWSEPRLFSVDIAARATELKTILREVLGDLAEEGALSPDALRRAERSLDAVSVAPAAGDLNRGLRPDLEISDNEQLAQAALEAIGDQIVVSESDSSLDEVIPSPQDNDLFLLNAFGGGVRAWTNSSRWEYYHDNSELTAVLDGQNSPTLGAWGELKMLDADGTGTQRGILFLGQTNTTSLGGEIELWAQPSVGGTSSRTLELQGAEGANNGSAIKMYAADGSLGIELDAEVGNGGNARIYTQELQINGGADISEHFEVSGVVEPEPGMVVVIDPSGSGELRVSNGAYERGVVGVISGAGGLNTGLMLRQASSIADGDHPVALTGRVYVWVDASDGPVEPGDLLTSSDRPGHAMRVGDHERAQGAVLGKAMTGLDQGQGLVLALVSLQ